MYVIRFLVNYEFSCVFEYTLKKHEYRTIFAVLGTANDFFLPTTDEHGITFRKHRQKT
jgi:hypothetical protein